MMPMNASSFAYTTSGCSARDTYRASVNEPMHMPPMKVPRSTASEIADDPMTSCST